MADDIPEKRKQQKELNWSLCRRVWRDGKKREVPEERRAEKSLTRRRGLKKGVGRCKRQKGATWAAAPWSDPCTREKEGCRCWRNLAVTHAGWFPFCYFLGRAQPGMKNTFPNFGSSVCASFWMERHAKVGFQIQLKFKLQGFDRDYWYSSPPKIVKTWALIRSLFHDTLPKMTNNFSRAVSM